MSQNLYEQPPLEQEAENPFKLEAGARTKASERHPTVNEDAILHLPEKGAFGVFDGMGGHSGGERASRMIRDYMQEQLENLSPNLTPQEIRDSLAGMIREADHLVDKARKSGEGDTQMGATGTVVKLWQGESGERKACVANIGDSRLYLAKSDGQLIQVTMDDDSFGHSANDSIKAARQELAHISNQQELEAASLDAKMLFRIRNAIGQTIGHGTARPTTYLVSLEQGDRLLLTSDGIHDNLTHTEMKNIISGMNPVEGAQQLTEAAQARSRTSHIRAKADDMTAILLDFDQTSHQEPLSTLHETTPLSGPQVEQQVKSLSEARNLNELYRAIQNLPEATIRGGAQDYGLLEIREIVEFIQTFDPSTLRLDQRPITMLTRNEGLRQKVYELLTEPEGASIEEAASFDDLYAILDALPDGGLFGSDGTTFYPTESLKADIRGLRLLGRESSSSNIPLHSLTRSGGLRDKVKQLIDKEI